MENNSLASKTGYQSVKTSCCWINIQCIERPADCSEEFSEGAWGALKETNRARRRFSVCDIVKAEISLSGFGQKGPLKIVNFLVGFSVIFFLLVFFRENGPKKKSTNKKKSPPKKHRGNQTPKSTSHFRKGVSLTVCDMCVAGAWAHMRPHKRHTYAFPQTTSFVVPNPVLPGFLETGKGNQPQS